MGMVYGIWNQKVYACEASLSTLSFLGDPRSYHGKWSGSVDEKVCKTLRAYDRRIKHTIPTCSFVNDAFACLIAFP
jgi:hypothetical protein